MTKFIILFPIIYGGLKFSKKYSKCLSRKKCEGVSLENSLLRFTQDQKSSNISHMNYAAIYPCQFYYNGRGQNRHSNIYNFRQISNY